MPSPMTISSAASAPIINHHLHQQQQQQHHHHHHLHQQQQHLHQQQQQQQQHGAPPPNPLNTLIQTGLISSAAPSSLLHHHHHPHHHGASSTTNAAPPPPSSMVSSSSSVAASIHHHHQHNQHHNSLQHNHLSHGHLLHEIYDISNKRNLMSHYGPGATGLPGIQIGSAGPIPQISSAIPGSVPGNMPLMTLHPGIATLPPGQHFAHIGPNSGNNVVAGYHPPPSSSSSSSSSSSLTSSNHHYYNPTIQQQQQQQQGHVATSSHKIISDGQSSSSLANLSLTTSSAAPPPTSTTTTSSGGSRVIDSNQQEMVIENIDDNVEEVYNPHFEAISPTPQDESRISPLTSLKDQILSSINVCDRQIQTIEVDINTLKSKAQQLEAATRKPLTDTDEEENKNGIKTEPTLIQKIIQENTMKAKRAHQHLNRLLGNNNNDENLSFINPFPCYNQPMDLPIIRENNEHHKKFRPKLIERILQYKKSVLKNQQLQAEKYDQQMIEWLKKIEKIESNPMKKQRDAKIRESFEKHFPEIRKQREDRERVQRNSTQQHRIRSEAELEEIMDGLQHQESEDKKMRSYVVIPPIKYTEIELKNHIRFVNQNGYLQDPMSLYKEIKNVNIWTESEKEIFREKYLMNPKKFGIIAQFLERKSIADCISYYYLSKKHENYKQLLRKHVKKRTRAMIKAQQQQNQLSQRGSPHLINNSHHHNSSQQSSSVTDGSSSSSLRHYPASATSVILPYSVPLTSSNATITFSISSSSSTNNNSGDNTSTTTTTTTSSSTSNTLTSNGPSSNVSSSQVNNNNINNTDCDNSDDNNNNNNNDLANGTSTPEGSSSICDNNQNNNNSDSSSIGCCLCCNDSIYSTNPQKSRPVTQTNYQSYGLQLSSLKLSTTSTSTKNQQKTTTNGNQIYGRVCYSCHLKKTQQQQQQQQQQSTTTISNLREKRHCPMPTCCSSSSNANSSSNSNSTAVKRKKLHLKQLPQQWLDMPDDDNVKQRISQELQIPLDVKIGCARCVLRISRRLNANNKNVDHQKIIETTNQHPPSILPTIDSSLMLKEDFRKLWSTDDQEKLRTMIRTHGKNWATISSVGGFDHQKTPQDCYRAFVLFKSEFQLTAALKEFCQSNGRPWNSAIDSGEDTDGDNGSSVGGAIDGDLSGDDTTASSLDGNNNNNESDTASASSSVGGGKSNTNNNNDQDVQNNNSTQKSGHQNSGSTTTTTTSNSSNLQDFKPLSLSQGSLKSDYDSSATMSADESSNANENANSGIDHRSGSFSGSFYGKNSGNNLKSENNKSDDNKFTSSTFNRDKLVGFDAPQVPMFLINPNAPSIQISSSLSSSSSTIQSNRTPTPSSNKLSSTTTATTTTTTTTTMTTIITTTVTTTTTATTPATTTTINNNDTQQINSNLQNCGGTCVRDLIYKAIEKSLQPAVSTNHEPIVKNEPCSTVQQQQQQQSTNILSTNNTNLASPLCLKREIPTPNPPPPPTQSSTSRQPTPDSSKMDILASTALQQQHQQQRSGLNLVIKPEGLAALNYPSSHSYNIPPSASFEDEVQDLSNKSSKRSYDQTITTMQRNSPKDYHHSHHPHHHHHSLNNKIMKMDPPTSSSARSSPSLNMPPHQVKSPFSHSPLLDQQRPPYAHSSNLISNHPASRIPNMIDAFMASAGGSSSVAAHIDPLKLNRSSGQSSNPYNSAAAAATSGLVQQQPSSVKINSKSSQLPQPPLSTTTFSISPKSETTIRDKLTNGSITQGTPVILQPGQLGQQIPSPHQQQQQQQAAALAALNVSVSAASKFLPPPPNHPVNVLPPSHHLPTGSLHPTIHYNEHFQQINPELAKGSITQGTPLIMPANNSANPNVLQPPPVPPLPSGTTPSNLQLIPNSPHYQLLNQSSRKNNDPVALDFAAASGGGSNKRSSKSNTSTIPTPYDFIERVKNYESVLQPQLPLYHRPFSPNYPTSSKPPPPPLPPSSSSSSGNSGITKSDSNNMSQILIDFNTSKQMQPRRSSASSEKESLERTVSQHQDPNRLIPPPPPSAPPPGVNTVDKHHSRTSSYRISPAPSPSSAIYLQDRVTSDKGAPPPPPPILDPQQQALLHWNPLAYLTRQNVIQQCFTQHQNPSSKGTSVIQSVPPREDLIKNSLSPRITNAAVNAHNFPPEHDALATLVNAAVQQPSLSVPNSSTNNTTSSVCSISSRLNKEGFEKCFSEGFAQHLGTTNPQTKQAVSNRIVYPPILNDSNHNQDMITDLSVNKSTKEDKYNNRNRLGSSSSSESRLSSAPSNMVHAENLDLMAKVAASSRGFPPPGTGIPPFGLPPGHLSEHERHLLLNEQQKKKSNFYPTDFHVALADHHQRANSASFRPESFGYSPLMNSSSAAAAAANPGLKFGRELNPFSPEHFERGLKQQVEQHSGSALKNDELKSPRSGGTTNKTTTSSGHSHQNSSESTMDEASKLFSQSFQKDRDLSSAVSGGITAANLIDAIITKQINTDSTKNSNNQIYQSSLNRLKNSNNNNNNNNPSPSPSNTPTPNNNNNVLNMKNVLPQSSEESRVLDIGGLFAQYKQPPPQSSNSGLDLSNLSGKPSLRDTIFSMITDNIQNNPSSSSSSPASSSSVVVTSGGSSRSSKNARTDDPVVTIAANNSTTSATTSNALVSENFKLRRALQPPMDTIDSSLHRQQVIHMAGSNVSTPPTSIVTSTASPSLPSNLKQQMSQHYIEPISPPNQGGGGGGGTSTNPQPTTSVPTGNWPNYLNFLPFGYNPSYPPAAAAAAAKLSNNDSSSIHHLPGGHDFFMANRIAEAMSRSSLSGAFASNNNSSLNNNNNNNQNQQQQQQEEKSSNETIVDANNSTSTTTTTTSLSTPTPVAVVSSRSSTPSSKKLSTNDEIKESSSVQSSAIQNVENSASTTNTTTTTTTTTTSTTTAITTTTITVDNNNSKTTMAPPLSFPDSPSSPGEMVIDENPRPSSPPTTSLSPDTQNTSNNEQVSTNDKKNDAIKLPNNSNENTTSSESVKSTTTTTTTSSTTTTTTPTTTATTSINNLSYEPLSDDEP